MKEAYDGQINNAFSTTFGASPAVLLGALGGSSTDTTTRYIQGTIELPDFLGKAELTDLTKLTTDQENNAKVVASAMRADHNWTANIEVGAMLDGALGKTLGTTPPKDVDGVSTNVTYRYPFPEPVTKDGDGKAVMIKAPYLLTLPDLTNNPACSGKTKIPTAIFVHGITSTRAGSAIYAAGLAQACIATVAIDLPVHGIAPADGMLTMLSMDTANAAKTSSPWAGVAAASQMTVTERHSNIWQKNENLMRVTMNYDVIAAAKALPSSTPEEKAAQKEKYAEGGSSGSAFINLQNFGRTHDNLRQAVTDLLNLNASLKNINADLDTDNVFVVGHSLGGIVASAFVAVNNDPEVQAYAGLINPANPVLPKVKGLILANTGGNITKLLENSPGFAPTIVGGLAKSGISQGTESFEKFLYVFQAMIDGVDPANTASKFGNIPVQLFTVTGHDGTSQVGAPDNTVPVRDYFADADTNPFKNAVNLENGPIKLPSAGVPTAKSFLAGTQAIKVASGLNSSSALKERTYGVANHSTFADAGASAGANAATAKTNFTDMVAKSIALINGAAASDGAQ